MKYEESKFGLTLQSGVYSNRHSYKQFDSGVGSNQFFEEKTLRCVFNLFPCDST